MTSWPDYCTRVAVRLVSWFLREPGFHGFCCAAGAVRGASAVLTRPPLKRIPSDAPGRNCTVPASLLTLLAVFSPLFTAPSFRTFCGLACGFLAQPGRRTVCGMLAGAGLSRLWPHDRAHSFFSRARWNVDDLGLAAARLVVSLLVLAGTPVDVAIDDTLFRRRGKRVWAASWFHDGSAQGPAKTGYGNSWVVLGVIVRLPVMSRPVAVPVMAKLVIKGTDSKSRLWLARRMAERLAAALPAGRSGSPRTPPAPAGN